MNKEQALQKIKELEEYIENLDKKGGRWKPNEAEEYYWFLESTGVVSQSWVHGTKLESRHKLGNCFPTKELAELHALRLEAMANRWKPDPDVIFFYWNFYRKEADREKWWNANSDLTKYIIGNCHKSAKEAEEWGKKYDLAFRVLWEDK